MNDDDETMTPIGMLVTATAADILKQRNPVWPTSTGIAALDAVAAGFMRSATTVVAAVPGAGKQLLVDNIAASVAMDGFAVSVADAVPILQSWEELREDIATRYYTGGRRLDLLVIKHLDLLISHARTHGVDPNLVLRDINDFSKIMKTHVLCVYSLDGASADHPPSIAAFGDDFDVECIVSAVWFVHRYRGPDDQQRLDLAVEVAYSRYSRGGLVVLRGEMGAPTFRGWDLAADGPLPIKRNGASRKGKL